VLRTQAPAAASDTSDMQGTCRAGLLGLALAGLLGCSAESLDAVPATPGSTHGPGSRQERDGQLLLKQSYRTPDAYLDVVEYYDTKTAQQSGWEGRANSDGFALFRKNLQVDGQLATARPVDPDAPGAAIMITVTPDSTQIQTYNSFPHAES